MSNTPPQRGLIDTELLIEIRSGQQDAHKFAIRLMRVFPLDMSELSAMGLIAGCGTAAELQRNVDFLKHCRVHRVTAPISNRAYRILVRLPPPSPLTADDAIVAATALVHKLPLYTLDPGRFAAVPGLPAARPY